MKHQSSHIGYRFAYSVLLFVLSVTAGAGTMPGAAPEGLPRSDHYLVSFSGDETDFRQEMRRINCSVDALWSSINIARVSNVGPEQFEALHASSRVVSFARDVNINWVNALSAEMNVNVQASAEMAAGVRPSDAEFYEIQWGLQQIDVAGAWNVTRGDPSVRVGVLDTGISPDHVDLQGVYDLAASINLSDSNPTDSRDFIDRHYHGTHVSALIASNNLGVASVAPEVTLVGVKVLDDDGNASFAHLIAGIMYAVDVADVDIINLSLGGIGTVDEIGTLAGMLHAAVDYAERNGVVVIASAGNDAEDLRKDALQSFVVTDEAGTLLVGASAAPSDSGIESTACYSNYGNGVVSIAAPGGSINCEESSFGTMSDMVLSAMAPAVARRLGLKNPDAWYMFAAGTSMAAPLVSGTAALILSAHAAMDPAAVCEKMKASADDLGAPGPDAQFGDGRLNAAHALR